MSRLMSNRETTVIIRNVLVPIVPALSEALFESITFVDQDRLKVARTMHISQISI